MGNLYRSKDQTDRTYHKGGKLLHDEKYHYLYDPNGNLKLKTPRKVAQRQIQLRQEQLNAHKPKKFSFFVEEVPQHKTKDLDYYLLNDRIYTKEEKEEYKRLKQAENLQTQQDQQWQRGDWEYHWNANGSLKSVKLPDGEIVSYEYDALGRRTKKLANGKIKRYLWDGNVLLHEWEYDKTEAPRRIVNKLGEVSFDKPEPVQNLITWVYEQGSFVPCAKLTEQGNYSIISDYLGTPIQAYNQQGELVWERELDIYGQTRKEKGISNFVPFRYQGQYYDEETNLCYNRFRYYNPETGLYISKDPISILGGLNVYAYVKDVNKFVDIFGLEPCSVEKVKKLVEQIPDEYKKIFMCKEFSSSLKNLMKENNIVGEQKMLNLNTSGDIISDNFGTIAKGSPISGAEHLFIKVDDMVFDNLNTNGINYELFMKDLGLDFAPKSVFNIKKLKW